MQSNGLGGSPRRQKTNRDASTLTRQETCKQWVLEKIRWGDSQIGFYEMPLVACSVSAGLAGNAAFIAAPRSLTRGVDLSGRTFLHSYDYTQDTDGSVLQMILSPPLVVAQWISMQYYLSTTDNDVFGSGSKAVHNVGGDFGIIQGSRGDLKVGLPTQSVMLKEGVRQHEPMRLLALIQAPLAAIDRVARAEAGCRFLTSKRIEEIK